MKQLFTAIIERIVAILCVLVFMQIPLFMQQYQQQLVGRLEELSLQMQTMQKAAGTRSLHQYIQKFQSSADPDFSNHGDFLQALVQRYESFTQAYTALTEASAWSKPFVFLAHLHSDVALSTFHHYDLGIPLNFEGIFYAALGLLIGLFIKRPGLQPARE